MAIEFSVSQQFAAPPDRVHAAMTDLDHAPDWMPGLVRIERLTPGDFAVGTRWRETRKMFDKEATEEFEVTECAPPGSLAVRVDGSRGTSGSGVFDFRYRLDPAEGGTLVVMDGTIDGMRGVMGFLGHFMVGAYRKACAKDLACLADHVAGRAS